MGLKMWLAESLPGSTGTKLVKGEAEVCLDFCTSKRSQGEGIKVKELWLEIKEGRNQSNVKAVCYSLLVSAW